MVVTPISLAQSINNAGSMNITHTILITAPLAISIHIELIISISEYTATPKVAAKSSSPLTIIDGIEVESASDEGLLVLSNIGNKRSDFKYLADALEKIAATNYQDIYYLENRKHMPMLEPQIKMSLRESFYA